MYRAPWSPFAVAFFAFALLLFAIVSGAAVRACLG